jgi:nicotinate-nucleotide adenylyltransferase
VPRIGVFGGSFNPIHFGHLLVADEVSETLGLERVLFVPAARPPHKVGADLAPAQDRVEMTALAVRERPGFEVCDLELRRPGLSYTVDTLSALANLGQLHLLIGSETFLDLLSWKEPARVAQLARLVVVPRSREEFDPEAPLAQKVLSALGLPGFIAPGGDASPAPVLVRATSLPISASDVRRRAREGRSLAYRLPAAVAAYVRDHRLYTAAS